MSRFVSLFLIGLFCGIGNANAAVAKKQSVIQNGTTIRARVPVTGIYNQECYDAYYGCMDQFCIVDNENGGSCACSDKNAEYEKQLADIKKTLDEANRISTEEVEKVRAGANADIIFNGSREYDENGNIVSLNAKDNKKDNKASRRESLLALWDTNFDVDDDVFADSIDSIADKTGNALFSAADNLCREQIGYSCSKDMAFLSQVYSRQIASDCKAFENAIAKQQSAAELALANANADVRSALRDSLNEANKYDLGQCMVEFKKCMLTEDACGADWTNCVSTVALENMQKTYSPYKAKKNNSYGISSETMEILSNKRTICERVLNSCVAVRDMVWPSFLKEAAPTIKFAESNAESKYRQSCLTNISKCIQKACKDDIAGRGVATMDACLSRPDMARSFCKVEIDPCEKMEPMIWSYVSDKLAAMRVDACTTEVKECFTDETRCGADFANCIGMDYNYIHDICPLDKLVVCKANNPEFSMNDLDSMLMGLYLNIDNAALDKCQNLVESKMVEICGSTTDCNKFAADDTMGTGSLRSVKDGNIYRITGMISFGSIKMGDASGIVDNGEESTKVLAPGEIGVQEYLAHVKATNVGVKDKQAIVDTIEAELNNIAGTINRTIELIEQDPEISFCINGRNLEQITGKKDKTSARFPNLLNQQKMLIAASALRQAQDNYNAKFNKAVADATKDASADLAQYMCQMMPVAGGAPIGAVDVETTLTPPYAISYEVGAGLDINTLAQGGRGSSATGTGGESTFGDKSSRQKSSGLATALSLGGSDIIISSIESLKQSAYSKVNLPNGTREMWSVFNRENRICHYCTSTVTKDCAVKQTNGFLGIGAKSETNCTESDPVEKCEDIQM